MFGLGDVLTEQQIQELVDYVRSLKGQAPESPAATPAATPSTTAAPTFVKDILPIFTAKCTMCHGSLGGWDASSYQKVMSTGDNGPVVVAKDTASSLLAQKLLGTQTTGTIMPPGGKLSDAEIQLILAWIAAGAPEK